VIPRYYVVAEREHSIQNPISEEKLLVLGERLRLGPGSRVLDIASGRGGPALTLARAFGCAVEGIEIEPEFHAAAVARAAEAGLDGLVSFRLGDAAREAFPPEGYDAALCLGATFVFGGLAGTLEALEPCARPGGHVVVGEPYWRSWPLPDDYPDRDEPFASLADTVAIVESGGLAVVALLDSSADEWDAYETRHWQAVEEWLAVHPDDPAATDVRSRHEGYKRTYLRFGRDLLGWAMFVGWKRGAP
jgi:SAM-dependent methyltransferase